jgi:hypothetical protein
MPWLLLVSFLTASYGAWPYDLVVLLVPVLEAAARLVHRGQREPLLLALAGYLGFNAVALTMNLLHVNAEWFIWMTPALLVGYFLSCWTPRPRLSALELSQSLRQAADSKIPS